MHVYKTISVFLFFLSLAGYANAGALEIDNARVHESPPTISILAAYMTITNTTDHDVIIREITSPDFERVEIHETIIKGDVATMVHQNKLNIPAGASVGLQPGGKHLMLISPDRPIRSGDTVGLTINLSDNSHIPLIVDVIRAGGQTYEHEHHHH